MGPRELPRPPGLPSEHDGLLGLESSHAGLSHQTSRPAALVCGDLPWYALSVNIVQSKFVMLDTAVLGQAAAKPRDHQFKELLTILCSGEWIPFLSWHQMEELVSHESTEVFRRRIDFFDNLPHIAYLRQAGGWPDIGSHVDVRDYEIGFLAGHLGAPHDEVIQAVSPNVRSGFCSGRQLMNENLGWWSYFRTRLARPNRLQKEEIANLTHFPVSDRKRRIPVSGLSKPPCSAEVAARRFGQMAARLSQQIIAHGDCRQVDPKVAASKLMKETYEETLPLLREGGDFMDKLLAQDGVLRSRLPKSATTEDVGYESIFIGQMGVHARRLLRAKDELIALVRKEQIPAWFIWQEVDRRMKDLQRAEIGNVNDKHMLAFGPYVEVMNVDKRIADLLRQAAKHHDLLQKVYRRVPEGRGIAGLLAHLRKN